MREAVLFAHDIIYVYCYRETFLIFRIGFLDVFISPAVEPEAAPFTEDIIIFSWEFLIANNMLFTNTMDEPFNPNYFDRFGFTKRFFARWFARRLF